MSDIVALIDAWTKGDETFEVHELLADAKAEVMRLRTELVAERVQHQKAELASHDAAITAERERCAELVINCYGMSVEDIAAAIRKGE